MIRVAAFRVVGLVRVAGAVSCGRGDQPGEPIRTTSARINAAPSQGDFAVYARNSIALRKNVVVSGGDVGVELASTGPFLTDGYEIGVQRFAQVALDRTVIGYSVKLLENASVGDINASDVNNAGGSHLLLGAFPSSMPSLPTAAAVQPGSSTLAVGQFVTQQITPSNWATISLGKNAVLRLEAGPYQAASVSLGDGARLEAIGPVVLRIQGKLDATNDAFIGAASGSTLTARDVRIEVNGINGTSGGLGADPKAANFGNHSEVHALVLAPNGTLITRSTVRVFGALLGQDVDVGEFTQVVYEDGFGQPGCAGGCDDANPCTADTCSGSSCAHTPFAAGTSCSDGDACNGDESCTSSGQCVRTGSSPDDFNPCTLDECDASTGVVTHTPLAAGSSCSDGDVCNGVESCDSTGRCQPGIRMIVEDDGTPGTLDFCDPERGVLHASIPAVDRTTFPGLEGTTAFLHSGANPLQWGVRSDALDPRRVAVVHGKVTDRDGVAVPSVRIRVVGHEELGTGTTRADGQYDLVVNGGGPNTLEYSISGMLPVQRQVVAEWQDYVHVDDVVMVGLDPRMTTVAFNDSSSAQVARSTPQIDDDGTRTATLFFPAGTKATMIMKDGSTMEPATLDIRATEYTVGPTGPKAMPAQLPPASHYTYAVELSADEAFQAGATMIAFDKPVACFVENFIGFPVGTTVPVGYYDRQRGRWIASESGRVIAITGVSSGTAEIDYDGDGQPEDVASLDALGIDEDERRMLGQNYSPGQTLWRSLASHFSAWDMNWGGGPPQDASSPQGSGGGSPGSGGPNGGGTGPGGSGNGDNDPDDPDNPCPPKQGAGSYISCEPQTLGESIPIAGTGYELAYVSSRTRGYAASRQLRVRLSGTTLPDSIVGIRLEVSVAGRTMESELRGSAASLADRVVDFEWDGKDRFGRELNGRHPARIAIGYIYPIVYEETDKFGYNGNGLVITGVRGGSEVVLWSTWNRRLGFFDSKPLGLGGWMLSHHASYNPATQTQYLGDGTKRSAASQPNVVRVVHENIPAPGWYSSLAAGPDGSVIINAHQSGIWRVRPDGGLEHLLDLPAHLGSSLAVGPDGEVYAASRDTLHPWWMNGYGTTLRRIDPDGTATVIAGAHGTPASSCGCGATGPGTSQAICEPYGLAVSTSGTLYMSVGFCIQRLTTDGELSTVPGTLGWPSIGALATDRHGALYAIADTQIMRISADGRIGVFAGKPAGQFSGDPGDGGPALLAEMHPSQLSVGNDGTVFVSDDVGHRVRAITTDGLIRTIAGDGNICPSGQQCGFGGPATAARIWGYYASAAPDGTLYTIQADYSYHLLRVMPPTPGMSITDYLVPDHEGSTVRRFDAAGRHLTTIDSLTGQTVETFAYDESGRLSMVTDRDGNAAAIERDISGDPLAIIAPFGQRTSLHLNGDGLLDQIVAPDGATHAIEYVDASGLIHAMTNARGGVSSYTYDPLGRLLTTTNAGQATHQLARTELPGGYSVELTSPTGKTSIYSVQSDATIDDRRENVFPDGLYAVSETLSNGTTFTQLPDGTTTTVRRVPDPRFGMLGAYDGFVSTRMPSGLTSVRTAARQSTTTNPNDLLSLQSLTETDSVNGRLSVSAFDATSRTWTRTSAAGRVTTTVLDAAGRTVRSEIPLVLPVGMSYDSHGRLESSTQGTRTHLFAYDPSSGYLASVTDPQSQTVLYERDAVGRTTRQTLPGGEFIDFSYDPAGNMTSLTPPGKPSHAMSYTPVNLLEDYVPPVVAGSGANLTHNTYDLDRNPLSILRPDLASIDLSYDLAGRLSAKTIPGGLLSYGYHPTTGKLVSLGGPYGVNLGFAYDGSLITDVIWTGEVAGTVHWDYDNDFRIVNETVNGGFGAVFGYDPDSLMTAAGALTRTLDPQNGRLTGTTLGSLSDSYGYDAYGALASYQSGSLVGVLYTRDDLGRITAKQETVEGLTHLYEYAYDVRGRLIEEKKDGSVVGHWVYDGNGNRLADTVAGKTGTYDDQDRMLTYGAASYTYTANGELLRKTESGQTTHYTYDVLGNLTTVELPDGRVIEYLVDGQGRRVGKQVNGALVKGWLYRSQLQPVAELDAAGNIAARYVYSTRVNVPDYVIKGGSTYRIITDHLGSVRLVVDASTGAVVQRIDYDAWGKVLSDTNPGFQPFGFAGGMYDPETGLVRFGARDYDAVVGRWTAKDSADYLEAETNGYLYAAGDPLNERDTTGDFPDSACVKSIVEGCKQGCNSVCDPLCVATCATLAISDEAIHPGTYCKKKPGPENCALIGSADRGPMQGARCTYRCPTKGVQHIILPPGTTSKNCPWTMRI